MKSVAQKIFIALGFITLITLSVIPVSTEAFTAAAAAKAVTEVAFAPIMVLLTPVFYGIMSIAAAGLGISGLLLDYIINISVVQLSDNLGKISAINNTWKVIRDLANMSFIFLLLYEGIRMVLGLGGTGVKKVVSGIIMAAILVNFSLFFTKVVIDASNIVTLGFYKSIVSAGTTQIAGYEANFGLTGAYMKALRLSSMYDLKTLGNIILNGPRGIIIFTGNTIFLLIAMFVFLAIAVMFIIRYLSFILLLIMSPVFFVSMAIPGLDGLKKKYSETLMSQALFAPVFMLLTWVLLTLAGDNGFLTSSVTTSFGDAVANPSKDTISLIVDYLLIIGLLIQSLVLSKNIATKGGYVTSKYIDKGTAFLGGTMFGGAAALGRNVIGSRAAAMAEDKGLQERADRGEKWAKFQLGAAKYGAKSSFDVRRSAIGEDASSRLGIDLGSGVPFNSKAGVGGYAGKKADKKKEFEGKLDEITKRYRDKNDWTKLAGVLRERSEGEQEYMYKSMSAKERVGLDMALANPIMTDRMKSKLSVDEKEKTEEETVKYYAKDKKWTDLVSYFNAKTGTTADADKQFIYKTLSPRDRVAFEKILAPSATLKTLLNAGITQEELEKTKEVAKKVERQERDEKHIDDIEALVAGIPTTNPSTGAPYTYDELLLGTGRNVFSPKNAQNLSDAALMEPEVIMRLKAKHLEDIQKNNIDIADSTIRYIKSVIDMAPYPPALTANQTSQKAFIGKPNNSDFWNI